MPGFPTRFIRSLLRSILSRIPPTRHLLSPALALTALLLFPPAALAHNGAAAVAVPVEGIAIDGDLSDWPEKARRYPIRLPEWETAPLNEADFQAFFRVGYSSRENALYIAVEVQDESVVVDTTMDWDTQDGCEIYIDWQHGRERSPLVQYALYGTHRNRGNFAVAVQRESGQHRYEWRVDASRDERTLEPGAILGLDVVATDKDADGTFSWIAWGRGIGKGEGVERRGDLILLDAGQRPGSIVGQVRWQGEEEGVGYALIDVSGTGTDSTWVRVRTDREGGYGLELPAGTYELALVGQESEEQGRTRIFVRPGQRIALPLTAALPVPQVSRIGPGRGVWQVLRAAGGIPSPFIHSLAIDRRGRLWGGTYGNGAFRYDGEEITTFTAEDGLANDYISAILEDRQGNIWFGTGDRWQNVEGRGATRYDGEHFTTFTKRDGLAGDTIWSILEDRQGNIWFGTDGGVSRYDGEHFTRFATGDGLASNKVSSILEDREGNLWFGTDGGLSRYDGRTWRSFAVGEGMINDWVMALAEDERGSLWVGTPLGLLRCGMAAGDLDCSPADFAAQLPDPYVMSMLEDREGSLWIGTRGGVSRYEGGELTTLTVADGLSHHIVLSMAENEAGEMWLGTGNGLSRYDSRGTVRFSKADGLPSDYISALLAEEDGGLWIGMQGGLGHYDGETLTHLIPTTYTQLHPHVALEVVALAPARDGGVWIGAHGGLVHWNGRIFSSFTAADGLVSNYIFSLLEDSRGDLWIGTRYGLSRYDGRRFTSFTEADGLADEWVVSILEDRQGNLWFGTDGGVSRYDGRTFHNLTTADGLIDDRVRSILEDRQGNLWFGTEGGLSRYDGRTFRNYTTRDGLINDAVSWLLEDEQGSLWIGTLGGISRYDGRIFQKVTEEEGLPDPVVLRMARDRRGTVWIGTPRGLLRYRVHRAPPSIQVVEAIADRRYTFPTSIGLSTSQEYLAFGFRGLSPLLHPERMAYLYRLKGWEEEWRWTREHQVEYTDLAAGEYTFQVEALDRDLNYSQQPAEVVVRVRLPYERIAWITMTIVGLGLFVWQSTRVLRRGRQLQRSNAELRLQARELEKARDDAETASRAKSLFLANMSHEIRTPMNAILGYAQILKRSPELDAGSRQAIETIEQSGDHLLKLINDVLDLSKIEANRMEMEEVAFDLADLLRTLGTMFSFHCGEKGLQWWMLGIDEEPIPVRGDENKLRQVLVNLLGNAVKFTDRGRVGLHLERLPDHLYRFSVHDMGPGLSPEDRDKLFEPFQQGTAGQRRGGTGLGLAIARRQLELMGAELGVGAVPGEGSCFFFSLRLPPVHRPDGGKRADWSRVRRLQPHGRIRALVVDDVAENRDILGRLLEELGAVVEKAESGRQLLERIDRLEPDILFLDIRMPEMDGVETLRRLRENPRWNDLKVVAVSASVLEHERRAFLAAGFDDFLDKPFRFEWVCERLSRLLGVEFEYAEEESREENDWSEMALPEELKIRLREAAELYSVTEIEELLDEIAALGERHRRLSTHLRALNQRQDMAAILRTIEEIPNG